MPEKDLGGVFRLFGCSELQNKNVRLKLPIREETHSISLRIYIVSFQSTRRSALVLLVQLVCVPQEIPRGATVNPVYLAPRWIEINVALVGKGGTRVRSQLVRLRASWLSYQKSEIASQLPIVALLPIQDFQP